MTHEPRVIKRYTNRKLYDTRDSRYVTLSQIAAMVRVGDDIKVIDNATKDDLTSLTLAQIIYEQEKRSSEVLPLSALRELVRRSEARLADLRDGPVGRLLNRPEGGEGAPAKEDGDPPRRLLLSSREAFEEWQRRVDERLRTLLDTLAPFRQLQEEMVHVAARLEELEGRLRKLAPRRRSEPDPGASTPPPPDSRREGGGGE